MSSIVMARWIQRSSCCGSVPVVGPGGPPPSSAALSHALERRRTRQPLLAQPLGDQGFVKRGWHRGYPTRNRKHPRKVIHRQAGARATAQVSFIGRAAPSETVGAQQIVARNVIGESPSDKLPRLPLGEPQISPGEKRTRPSTSLFQRPDKGRRWGRLCRLS